MRSTATPSISQRFAGLLGCAFAIVLIAMPALLLDLGGLQAAAYYRLA